MNLMSVIIDTDDNSQEWSINKSQMLNRQQSIPNLSLDLTNTSGHDKSMAYTTYIHDWFFKSDWDKTYKIFNNSVNVNNIIISILVLKRSPDTHSY